MRNSRCTLGNPISSQPFILPLLPPIFLDTSVHHEHSASRSRPFPHPDRRSFTRENWRLRDLSERAVVSRLRRREATTQKLYRICGRRDRFPATTFAFEALAQPFGSLFSYFKRRQPTSFRLTERAYTAHQKLVHVLKAPFPLVSLFPFVPLLLLSSFLLRTPPGR